MSRTNKATRYLEAGYRYFTQIDDSNKIQSRDISSRRRYTTWEASNTDMYTAIEGETYRSISLERYGREDYWWILADVNPLIPTYEGAFGLQAGTILEVPSEEFLP